MKIFSILKLNDGLVRRNDQPSGLKPLAENSSRLNRDPVWKLPSGQCLTHKGFTLIELLVSLFILSAIGSLVIGIIWVSLRNSVKLNNMNLIRQNGNYAMLQMTKMLQFASRFQGVSTDGSTFTTNCQDPNVTPLQSYNYIRYATASDDVVTLSCMQSPSTIASNSASLLDTSTFSVVSCGFTCIQVVTEGPYAIGIRFIVQKNISGNLFDEPAPLLFQTTVTLRNSSLR